MMETVMYLFAALCGLIIGCLMAVRFTLVVLVVFYHYRFRKEEDYLKLYNLMDDEYGYEVMKTYNESLTSYSKYLKAHQDARSSAYSHFKKDYKEAIKYSIIYLLLAVLLPTLIFWQYGIFYFVTILAVFVAYSLFLYYVKKYRMDFYVRLVANTTIADHIKNTSKLKK